MKTEDFRDAAIEPRGRHNPVQRDSYLTRITSGEGTMRARFLSDLGFFLMAFVLAGLVLGADSNAAEILHQLVH
jgi:hypothetical protein